MSNKIRIYVGHKLTKAKPDFLERMERIRRHAEQVLADRCEFMKFLGVKDGTPLDVFQQDIEKNVGECHLFVCIIDEESTGLGMEIGAAAWKSGKPILLVRTEHAQVSRLPIGAVQRYPEQIMERVMAETSVVDANDFVSFIEEAISKYRLATDAPVSFPNLDEMSR